jgi:beta-galactosidase
MGCNGIRTSHNPPAPELLDLCDRMGFIVMDEAFDMWKMQKTKYDYHLYWDQWHKRDLQDQLLRDRNHPSVFVWSIGNEIGEQYSKTDTSGRNIARELAAIVRSMDNRPITSANNDPSKNNNLIASGALDLIGYNYHEFDYAKFHERFPGKKFIATETTSGLETRGYYEMPSDSIRIWPPQWDKPLIREGNNVSAYDNTRPPWGSTHEATWKVMKKYDHLSGMFIWTGFDYLGEPTPYSWPSRSSYFGVIDLAGFPKDVYYMYQSEWTDKPVLHIFPHWNWEPGKMIDIWAYYNNADEVELYLNGKSVGIKKKTGDDLHIMWRLKFEPGTLKAVSRKNGKVVLTKEIKTAGAPAKIELIADRSNIKADGKDLSFITVKVLDKNGNLVPNAANRIKFTILGGTLVSVDNGNPVSHDSFRANNVKAFHGLALGVVKGRETAGNIRITATALGLKQQTIELKAK